jgi:SAM-dependent methyltransferase
MTRKILLVGAGSNRDKKLRFPGEAPEWNGKITTVDIHPSADVVHDMGKRPFPFKDGEFDEVHAYDSLEHWGVQGDWRGWFDEMGEFHRILKPGGTFAAIVPLGADHFADPGHTRFLSLNHFLFLNQQWYDEQKELDTSATDYRWYWKLNFDILAANTMGEPAHHLGVLLRKEGYAPLREPGLIEKLTRKLLTVRA